MKPFHPLFSFLACCLVVGCASFQPTSSPVSADEAQFNAIVRFYRERCPATKFEAHTVHFCDGPRGERMHINVPVVLQAAYVHPFCAAFLERKSRSPEGLERMIAEDLSYLRCKLLFKVEGARASYDGASFDCIAYVVETDSPQPK